MASSLIVVDTELTSPPTGGAHTFLVPLCGGLVRQGWQVTVVTQPGRDDTLVQELRRTDVRVREDLWKAWHLPEDRARKLASWVAATSPDAYVVSVSPDAGWLALPLLPPAVLTVSIAHNDVEAFYAPLRYYEPFVDCAVGVSRETHRRIIADCRIPGERTRLIPYGVARLSRAAMEASLAAAPAGAPLRIGYVGRIEQRQKRIMDIVPLMRQLVERSVAFELHLVGDGSDRRRLCAALEREGLSRRVRWWGWLSSEGVHERLSGLDAFILLSDREGLPVALLQAMGYAVAPLVTRTASGNAEVIHDGENGYLLPIGDTGAFAARLEELARSRAELTRVRRAAWQTSQHYSVERMVESYRSVLLSSAQGATRRAPRPSGAFPPMPSCRSPYPRWARKLKALARTGVRGR